MARLRDAATSTYSECHAYYAYHQLIVELIRCIAVTGGETGSAPGPRAVGGTESNRLTASSAPPEPFAAVYLRASKV
jgi:hypothetical protein